MLTVSLYAVPQPKVSAWVYYRDRVHGLDCTFSKLPVWIHIFFYLVLCPAAGWRAHCPTSRLPGVFAPVLFKGNRFCSLWTDGLGHVQKGEMDFGGYFFFQLALLAAADCQPRVTPGLGEEAEGALG